MRWLIRTFFRTVRLLLGPVMLLSEWLTTPKGVTRPEQEQRRVDEQTRDLILYQFRTCPFCIKVRRTIKRLSLNIETRDAQKNPQHRSELIQGGGEAKVPCLRIDEAGVSKWLYESDEIIAYLEQRFATS